MQPITRIEILRVAQHMHQRGSNTPDKTLSRACHETAEMLASEAQRLQEAGEAELYAPQADIRALGPGTLDVLLSAETADPGAVCGAIEALAGEGSWAGVLGHGAGMRGHGFVVNGATLAALVRTLRGGIQT